MCKPTDFTQQFRVVTQHPFKHQHAGCCDGGQGTDKQPPPRYVGVPPRQHQRRQHPPEHQHSGEVHHRLHGVKGVSTVSEYGQSPHQFHFKCRIVNDTVASCSHAARRFDSSRLNDAVGFTVFPRAFSSRPRRSPTCSMSGPSSSSTVSTRRACSSPRSQFG